MPDKPKAIYLTFDDGPTPEVTDWVLKTLKQYQAKATFFCVGNQIEKNASILKKIHLAGHQIGNHTFSHLNGWKTKNKQYLNEVIKTEVLIDTQIERDNTSTLLFRPPYGKIKKSQAKLLREMGYTIVMLDIISGDFDINLDPEKSLEKVLKYAKSGSVIVFHDSKKAFKTLQYVLPKALEIWKGKAYQFLDFRALPIH
jgi:peptidoglycan/xylan/chitin deacetylase (PgdA/CDA1 family)